MKEITVQNVKTAEELKKEVLAGNKPGEWKAKSGSGRGLGPFPSFLHGSHADIDIDKAGVPWYNEMNDSVFRNGEGVQGASPLPWANLTRARDPPKILPVTPPEADPLTFPDIDITLGERQTYLG